MAALEVTERTPLSHMDCYIIHEVYDGDFSQEQFEAELDAALEHQYRYIVIEPARLGDETARWISVGNCLHRTSVITGAVCLLSPLGLSSNCAYYLGLPAGAVSVACAALYCVSWQPDPCCQYQVDQSGRELTRLPPGTLRTSSPVVLVRNEDTQRKRLHNVIALTALAYCAQKIFELCTD
ncbi:transmembrane protein 11, mitochondrial [Bombina bombina]|uniref:transmembrane protein 11, mitochondrial n=1 Tax=Bombina bombina TaxID=8345 RepID=UPI00235AC03F|nr:transmembrane protein 11, mitochondrial [Bombina bombina]